MQTERSSRSVLDIVAFPCLLNHQNSTKVLFVLSFLDRHVDGRRYDVVGQCFVHELQCACIITRFLMHELVKMVLIAILHNHLRLLVQLVMKFSFEIFFEEV